VIFHGRKGRALERGSSWARTRVLITKGISPGRRKRKEQANNAFVGDGKGGDGPM